MDYDHLQPRTLIGIKKLAKKIKKRDGITHAKALDAAACQAGWSSYSQARAEMPGHEPTSVLPGSALPRLLRGEV